MDGEHGETEGVRHFTKILSRQTKLGRYLWEADFFETIEAPHTEKLSAGELPRRVRQYEDRFNGEGIRMHCWASRW